MHKPNVILIVCDGLRKDVMRIYGGSAVCPNIEELAKGGIAYQNAIAVNSLSLCAHASLFTGLYPKDTGIHESGRMDKTEVELISENSEKYREVKTSRIQDELKKLGYTTGGLSCNPWITPYSGFGRGFDWFFFIDQVPSSIMQEYREVWNLGATVPQILVQLIKEGRFDDIVRYGGVRDKLEKVRKALNYPIDKGATFLNSLVLNSQMQAPFYLFINYFETHNPYKGEKRIDIENNYVGLKKISKSTAAMLKQRYVEETEYVDKKIGELIIILKEANCYDNTLIILIGDHGQAFNEHGFMYHGVYLYDELVRVPMIVKYPEGYKGRKDREGYQSITRIKDFIIDIANGGDGSVLNTPVAFAEGYGVDDKLLPSQLSQKEFVDKTYNKKRVAVFKDGNKLVLNRTDDIVEETQINSKDPEKTKAELLNEIKKFYSSK